MSLYDNEFCSACQAYMFDSHDCDNCAFCGTDNSREEAREDIDK